MLLCNGWGATTTRHKSRIIMARQILPLKREACIVYAQPQPQFSHRLPCRRCHTVKSHRQAPLIAPLPPSTSTVPRHTRHQRQGNIDMSTTNNSWSLVPPTVLAAACGRTFVQIHLQPHTQTRTRTQAKLRCPSAASASNQARWFKHNTKPRDTPPKPAHSMKRAADCLPQPGAARSRVAACAVAWVARLVLSPIPHVAPAAAAADAAAADAAAAEKADNQPWLPSRRQVRRCPHQHTATTKPSHSRCPQTPRH